MLKIFRWIIIPAGVLFLLVAGIILSLKANPVCLSIGTGLLSSSIVSIVVWLLQIIDNIQNKSNIIRNLYNLIKREIIMKIEMVGIFLLNDTGTLCEYLRDLCIKSKICYKEKKGKENLMLYLERFVGTETFSGYTHQILRLLDYSLNQNLIRLEDYNRLNAMFQYEISILSLQKEGKEYEAIGFFSNYLNHMLSVIEKDKNLKVFREIKIVDDEFFIEEEKMSKDDRALIGIFIHKRAK